MSNTNPLTRPHLTPLRILLALLLIVAGWVIGKFYVNAYSLGQVDSAIFSMRRLVTNQDAYAKLHPNLGYSCNLTDLLADTAIKDGKRSGYAFEITDCSSSKPGGPTTTYHLLARPLRSRMPAFCADQSGVLKADYTGTPADCQRNGQTL